MSPRDWSTNVPRLATQDDTFHFDPLNHEYFLNGALVPSITQMLERAGYVDDLYYTEESCERGTMVHKLAADYDLGAIKDPRRLECVWKGYVLAHVDAMKTLKPEILEVEVARGSKEHRFGGRPDRVVKLWGALGVIDEKTGASADWHGIQTALQSILIAPDYRLPPTSIQRHGLYLKDNGKWKLLEHKNPQDFARAYEVIRTCAKAA